jgi:PAS domain S-box-containing protein
MTEAPGNATRSRGPAEAWSTWYARFVLAGLVVAVGFGLAAFLLGRGEAPAILRVPTYVILPPAIAALVVAGRNGRSGYLILAALLIDIEALLVAVVMAMGLALAVLFPLIGLSLLLDAVRGRTLTIAFVAAGLTGLTGVMLGLAVGPVSHSQQLSDPFVVLGAGLLFVVYGLGHLYRLNTRRTQAIETATAELASRHAAEAELDRTSQVLAAIVRSSPVPTQVIDAGGKVILWNPASERVFGWKAGETVGAPLPARMTPKEERRGSADRMRRVLAGQVVQGERVRRLTKDGREVWVDIYAAPLHGGDGAPIGIARQLVDVTERIAIETRLGQAAKMEAIGGLAGGVAHDFNNILTAIHGYAELARDQLSEEQRVARTDLEEVIRAADKAAGLTRQLLAFARRTVVEFRALDPAAVISEFAPMLRRLLGEDIHLALELAPDTGRVKADPIQLEQVILNLAVNARDAMPSGGTLRIATANVDLSAAYAATHPDTPAGPYVEIAVKDSGSGMDEITQSRMFEPFFTTKEPGKGTGMGLATVFGIVRLSGGWIDVASKPRRGTTFRLFFPRLTADGAAETAPTASGDIAGGNETILLVEDDPAVRAFSQRCLTELGYAVIEAVDGGEALKLAGSHAGPIDLLVTDVVMPGLRGPELARRLQKMRPSIRTVFCSGFAGGVAGGEGSAKGTYLAKPYSREDLGWAVRALLDRAD